MFMSLTYTMELSVLEMARALINISNHDCCFFYYISIDSYTMNFQDLHHLLEFLSLLLKALYIDTETNQILLVPFSIPYGSLYQSS